MATRTTTFATNDVLTADDLNSLAGASNAYTPTISGGWAIGNGTVTGKYLQLGKLVFMYAKLTVGSSTTMSGACSFSVPVTWSRSWGAVGRFNDASAPQSYYGNANAGSTVGLYVSGTNGINAGTSSTVPFTWAAGDSVEVWQIYEAA